jgi:general secretion pathway protein M
MTRDSLNASLAARGLTPQSLTMTGEYAKAAVERRAVRRPGGLARRERRDSRILVQDASFTAQDRAGVVNATLTLRQNTGMRPHEARRCYGCWSPWPSR